MKKRFSLVEAILVCAIVSILASFIFTKSKEIRLEGKRLDCLNNMKQIQLMLEANKLKTGDWGDIEESCTHTGLPYFINRDIDAIEETEGGHINIVYLHSSKNSNGGIATTKDAITETETKTKNNNGHGNNIDGVDKSNPGKSKNGEDSDPNIDDER